MLVQPAPTVNQNPSVGFSAVTKKLWNMVCKIKVGTLTISTRPYRTAKSSISPFGTHQDRHRAEDEQAQHRERHASKERRQDKQTEIAVRLVLIPLAQGDAHNGAAAGAQHKAHRANEHGQRHDQVDRCKGCFAHKVGDTQTVHDTINGREQHGTDAGQHKAQQARIIKMIR